MTKKTTRKLASAIVLQRAPHVATGEIVQMFGCDAAKRLYSAFAEFNEAHFAGQLGAPMVLITQPQTPRTLADYTPRDAHGLESRMRIAPRVVARGERFMLDALLHEMVHAWQEEIDEDGEPGYRGHGPRFAKKCNEIGAALGLPEVGVKGRGGLPDCKHWPLNVRPEGYYPEGFAAPTRKEKKPAAPKAPRERAPEPEIDLVGQIQHLLHRLSVGQLETMERLVANVLDEKRRDGAQGLEVAA